MGGNYGADVEVCQQIGPVRVGGVEPAGPLQEVLGGREVMLHNRSERVIDHFAGRITFRLPQPGGGELGADGGVAGVADDPQRILLAEEAGTRMVFNHPQQL